MTTTKLAGLGLLSLGLAASLTACFGGSDKECDTALGDCGDSVEADADADSDADSDTDADPEYFEPYVFGMDFYAGYDGAGMVAYGFGDGNVQDPFAAITVFEEAYFDSGGDTRYTCEETYLITENGVDRLRLDHIYAGCDVSLTHYPGATHSPWRDFDPSIWGDETGVTVFEGATLGVGMGPMSAQWETTVKDAVVSAGLDWEADWAPYLLTYYPGIYDASSGGLVGVESGFGFTYQTDENMDLMYNADDELMSYEISGLEALPSPALLNGRAYYLIYTDNLF